MAKAAQMWADAITESFIKAANPYQPGFPVPNQAPVVARTISDQAAIAGYTIPFTTFSDPNHDVLSFQVTGLPAGLSVNGLTISGTPTTAGTATITVKATDPNGLFVAPVTGTYSFRTNNDDGTRVWVTNQLLIDNWADQGPTPKEGSISLTAGQKYDIKVEYYEAYGGAQALLYWVVPGSGSAVIVPRERLYPGSVPPANRAPVVASPIPNQNATVGTAFNYSIPASTFSDPDAMR
ncbi:PA14 domain-containing protein [Nibrella saemangeumensis]